MEAKTVEESSNKSSSLVAEVSIGFTCFKAKVAVKDSISSRKENTRRIDTSTKYHVELYARDDRISERFLRILDIIKTLYSQEWKVQLGN